MRFESRRSSAAAGRVTLGLALLIAASSCSRSGAADRRRELVVFAAASLTEAFTELARAFEGRFPHTHVLLNLAGSQTLRLQIEQGAAADLFASANLRHLDTLVKQGRIAQHEPFASNAMVVAVPRDNPRGLRRFADLPRARKIVIGDAQVPIGSYTDALLRRAGQRYGADFRRQVEQRIASRESNVRLVLAKVELAEADAAIVYRSDVAHAGRVIALEIPADLAERPIYAIGQLRDAPAPALARAWLGLLRGRVGREILERHAFTVVGPA